MIKLGEWPRGFVFWPSQKADLRMYLWFYEWTLFDAVTVGQHTGGYWTPTKKLSEKHQEGKLSHPGIKLSVVAREEDTRLTLTVTNESEHEWPEIAAIIPCFNPGWANEQDNAPPTPQFFDLERDRTWYLSADELTRLDNRDIHFNHLLRPSIDKISEDGKYFFSKKWPTSSRDASAGIMIRESNNGEWVTGIGWSDFVSVQGHNPWRCMHLSVRVGPLPPGKTKTVRGGIYLFRGNKEDCLDRFIREIA